MTNKSKISNLIALGSKTEEAEKKTITKKEEALNIESTSEPKSTQKKETVETEHITTLKPIEDLSGEPYEKYKAVFEKTEYGVGEITIKIPLSIHKQIKLLAVHTDVSFQVIVSNVLNQFLTENAKEIKKSLKI